MVASRQSTQLRTGEPELEDGSGETSQCTLMPPGACKIRCGCNVLQSVIQIVHLGVSKRGKSPIRGGLKLWWHASGSSLRMSPRPLTIAHCVQLLNKSWLDGLIVELDFHSGLLPTGYHLANSGSETCHCNFDPPQTGIFFFFFNTWACRLEWMLLSLQCLKEIVWQPAK